MTPLPYPLVIMAGGKSSRMGSDKALLPFGTFSTLTEFQLFKWKNHFHTLHVSCKTKAKFDFDASFIEDDASFHESSPLIALFTILKDAQTPVCVLSVDTPFVTMEIFERLVNAMDEKSDAIIARSPFGAHPLCAIYRPCLSGYIAHMIENNEHKIQRLLQNVSTHYVDFDDDAPFFNLNYPHEYETAKVLL